MARTTQMKLIDLMVLKQDIVSVIEYIGKKGSFQFQKKYSLSENNPSEEKNDASTNYEIYEQLRNAAVFLSLSELPIDIKDTKVPDEETIEAARKFLVSFDELQTQLDFARENLSKIENTYSEALAFANLQVSYSELEHLSFLSLKIGKIVPEEFESIKMDLEDGSVVIPLGQDKSRILVASSKKGRFSVDSILSNHGFVEIEVPKEFNGVPQDMLDSLEEQKKECENYLKEMQTEKENFAETHKEKLLNLLASFSIAVQIENIQKNLESTELVYRLTGWIPKEECETYMKELDEITESRIAIRQYDPQELPAVISGKEQVPVKLTHGKFVASFERMIFSYGAPIYGTIDPTAFVALFFTLLFGIMFGDLGQGLIIAIVGLLMALKVIKVGNWNKFAPVFMAVGFSSSIMGRLTGEVFSNETLLEPFSMWVTGLFGTPHAPILKMMPSSDPASIKVMFGVFGVAVGIGFIINSIGLIINIINSFLKRRYDEAFFGKNGIAGAVFFWYIIALVLRIALLKHSIAVYDWVIIGVSLFFSAFAEPFERIIRHEKPVLENGVGTFLISGFVEVIEVISGYLSNTVSFVRVGAFALSHAVLDYVILILTEMCGPIGGIFVLIIGNAIIIVLEGMIVAIQVIRLQYYEFFSKFFHESGMEFDPFNFSEKI